MNIEFKTSEEEQKAVSDLKEKLRAVLSESELYKAESEARSVTFSVYALLELAVEVAPKDSSFVDEAFAEVLHHIGDKRQRAQLYA
jgi:hypothetical protein